MNQKKRLIKTAIIVILAFLYSFQWYSNCVKPAKSLLEALIQKDNINYFIVTRFGFLGDGDWGYLNGTKLIPAFLAGKDPASELSWIISGQGISNRFLIKGYIDPALSEIAGRDVIVVEDWDIIAPIFRIYEKEDPNRRIFSPHFYLDKYDIETGVYFQIVSDIRAIRWFEVEKIKRESELDCYVITSEIIDNEVQWYLVEDREKTMIHLAGNPLEAHFNEKILSNCQNKFFVEGTFDKEHSELIVERWYIKYPIFRSEFVPHESHYYFTEQDVLDGVYMP